MVTENRSIVEQARTRARQDRTAHGGPDVLGAPVRAPRDARASSGGRDGSDAARDSARARRRAGSLTAPGFREAWQRWLRLSNLLGARLAKPVTITTASAAASVVVEPTLPVSEESRTDLSTEWQELIALAESDEAAVLESSRNWASPSPVLGHETTSGIPVPVAWPEERIALDALLSDADRDDLLGEGWSLVSPSDDPALLRIPRHRKDS